MTENTKMMEIPPPSEETPTASGDAIPQPPSLGGAVQDMSMAFSRRVTTKMERLLERLEELQEIEAQLAAAGSSTTEELVQVASDPDSNPEI